MPASRRRTFRILAVAVLFGAAASTASAQVGTNPQPTPIVRKNLIQGMPSVNSFPGLPAYNLFPQAYRTPSFLDPPEQDYSWLSPAIYPTARPNPYAINPFHNNPFVLNPLLNPALNNPFAVPRYNPGYNPLTAAVVYAAPMPSLIYPVSAGLSSTSSNPLGGTVFNPAPGGVAVPVTNNGFIPYVVR